MSELKIMNNNRVDHPRKKSKDLADAVCGAVFGAISHTAKDQNLEVEVHTWSSPSRFDKEKQGMIELEPKEVPDDVRDYLDKFNLI
jgi:hypothetical protein